MKINNYICINMIWHILPINDSLPHIETGSTCHCDPTVKLLDSGDIMIVHNSYDGREGLELANEILSTNDRQRKSP